MAEDDYSYENLKKFTYLENVQKEVNRFYGPSNGSFRRVALNDDYLKGVPIQKGTTVGIQPLGTHYS